MKITNMMRWILYATGVRKPGLRIRNMHESDPNFAHAAAAAATLTRNEQHERGEVVIARDFIYAIGQMPEFGRWLEPGFEVRQHDLDVFVDAMSQHRMRSRQFEELNAQEVDCAKLVHRIFQAEIAAGDLAGDRWGMQTLRRYVELWEPEAHKRARGAQGAQGSQGARKERRHATTQE